MKRRVTIIGILLVLMIAGNACHNPWHERSDLRDSGKMIRMRMGKNFRYARGMPGMRGMRRGMGQGMGFGNMRDMGRMPMDSIGRMPMGTGRWILESIPNVTENQKKLIEDLTKKHFDEMKKIREEMFSKMQSQMDLHRNDILSILTDEQKKFIESGRSKSFPVQEDAK